jgi:CDP-6-deoxy-D-xylo-4-hexulose-3-dehydrase
MNPNPKIPLAKDTIDVDDFNALCDWLKTYPKLTKGEQTIIYEEKYAKSVNCKYSVFVNSGSSANLLMIYSLIVSGRLKNKKVMIPALSWITDISPVMQFGMEPILIDVNMDNLAVDLKDLEDAIKIEEPAILILVSVLGLVPDMQEIKDICDKYDVILLIDNCEGQGSKYKGQYLEEFGLMSSCSSYYGHCSSTIEGGTISTNDKELYDLLKMLRSHGWDRDLDPEKRSELRKKWETEPFNALYTFYEAGFNVRATDLQAFIGIRQLDKLEKFVSARNKNYNLFNKLILNNEWKPKQYDDRYVSNLGYPIIHHKRQKIVEALLAAGVEVRPLISGSMGMQPFFIKEYGMLPLANVSLVDERGMYVPNFATLTTDEVIYMCNIINKAINE